MEQSSTRQCHYCKKTQSWIWSGKKLKDGSRIYVDEDARRWSGRRCPACERSRVYAAVRCDSFERDIIIRQFKKSGFDVKSKTLPLKVAKDGQTYTVGIKRAFTDEGKIILETPMDKNSDIIALVFESVRICTSDQLGQVNPNVGVYAEPLQPSL